MAVFYIKMMELRTNHLVRQARYDTLLEMRMNNEIPKEVFYRKQTEVEQRMAELERQMAQYQDVKEATDEDVSDKLKNLKKLLEQGLVLRDGEFTEEDIDKYVYGGKGIRRPL